MFSINKPQNQGMIKFKKRDYSSEKKETFYMNKGIQSGAIANDRIEQVWRGRAKHLYTNSYPEEKYMINDLLKKFQLSQDEKKGYNFKYVLEISDLLGKKDKNFKKKRLELYYSRLNNRKKTLLNKTEKNLLEEYKKPKVPKTPNIRLENIKKPKTFVTNIGNNKNKSYHNINNKGNIVNINPYNKTSYNYNSPQKIASLKYLLTDHKNKNFLIDKKIKNNIKSSLYLTQYNSKDDDSLDTTSLEGKEAFLFSGDRENYHEYLKKQFKFFEQPKIRQAKYLLEKQKRIKLFKKLPNSKFLNIKKEPSLKTEIFNRIHREKNHVYLNKQKDLLRIEKKKKFDLLNNKKINKLNFFKECKSILLNIEKNLNQQK